MNNAQIKKCPFCGGHAVDELEYWTNPNGFEWGSCRYALVECSQCHAKSGIVNVDNFNRFSKHTVQEFRENNLLRAREEERYEEYVDFQKLRAIELWNKRTSEI